MKLEIKHIASYLPYGLKIEPIYKSTSQGGYHQRELNPYILDNYELDEIKPILRPLSDLTKEIEVNGEKFVPIKKLQSIFSKRIRFDEDGFYNHDLKSLVNQGGDKPFSFNQLDAYSYLFQWHFDVFRLIPQSLAIDINSLNNEG